MDNYVLVERLGQGSFAIVWKARRKSDHRLVAVKQLKQAPSTWEECKRLPEIRAAAAVRGPHIIALLEAVRHGNELFLVFEYADSDLYRCLGPCERRRFEETQVRWVMRQLFSALASVHAAGLVHCDVKPENLLLFARLGPCGEPILKMCDLGQATPAGEVPSYVGTRWYRAPELLLGVERTGVEIDLWAAGCFMAELILLRPPFPGTDTRDMLFRICSALGAPEEGWHLSERLMQASGLRFAPCAAEGPLWFELSSSGASSSAVQVVRGLLRYNQAQRLPAARALHSAFFQGGLPEVPVAPPEKDIGRLRSADGLARSRDEAKAVNKKLQAASAATGLAPPGPFTGFGGTGLGGLGLSVSEAGPTIGLSGSASASSLPSGPSVPTHAGYTPGLSSSASATSLMPTSQAAGTLNGDNSTLSTMRRQHTERSGLPGLSAAHRRVAHERRGRRDLGQGFSREPHAPPRDPRDSRGNAEPWSPGRQPGPPLATNLDLMPPLGAARAPSSASSEATPEGGHRVLGPVSLRARDDDGSGGSGGEGDDEELAALFWSKVEHSRGQSAGRVREQENVEP